MMKKKIILILFTLFSFFNVNNLFAYNSNEAINIYIEWNNDWTNFYNVPEWKDLIINRIYSNDVNSYISVRNLNWTTLYSRIWKEEYTGGFISISDELEVMTENANGARIDIFGYLVSEDEDIQYYLQWDSDAWNKHIFDKEDIDFIYFREFILFIFLMVIKFFEFIIWRKLLMR